ncbi:MAG: hypothetical protein LIP23_09650 [Planctomycetes bacterium]|nr:hypothetical protein [Planctomycetota bacterium]
MSNNAQPGAAKRRERLGIHFRCCHVYGNVFKNKAGTAYVGWCPKCMKKLEVKISKDGNGTDQRIFQTS